MKAKFTILLIAVLIAVLGILSIYSSTYQKEGHALNSIYQRQILWVILGLLLFSLTANFNYRRLWDVTYILYALTLVLLFLVFVLGIARQGAQRWLKFAGFNFQPSEIAKLALVIFLAKYFSRKSADEVNLLAHKFGIFRAIFLPSLAVGVPAILIMEQPDLGSAAMVIFIFIIMLFLGGVRLKYVIMFIAMIILSVPFLWQTLRDYQRDRLLVFLNPNIDPLGAGYTIIQSKIAIGSGSFFGKGFLGGTQSQLHFLPEAHTDFIFATFTEEWGLLGSSLLLFLYFLLIYRGIQIASRTHDYFGRSLALGVSLMLGIQIFVNIAMNLGFAPVVGVPLPLMSYGGSSVLITFISLGILANIDETRAVF